MIFEKIREKMIAKRDSICKTKNDCIALSDAEVNGVTFANFDDAIDIVNQVEAEYNNGWVKCEGKTFAVGCKYLIVDRDNDIYIATYLNNNVFATRDKDYFMPIKLEATYCQLLPLPPQPPKGE